MQARKPLFGGWTSFLLLPSCSTSFRSKQLGVACAGRVSLSCGAGHSGSPKAAMPQPHCGDLAASQTFTGVAGGVPIIISHLKQNSDLSHMYWLVPLLTTVCTASGCGGASEPFRWVWTPLCTVSRANRGRKQVPLSLRTY